MVDDKQNQTSANPLEPEPPWRKYPGEETFWGGWRQGHSEAWLKDIWLPFWSSLTHEDRLAYLEKWNAPDQWREHILKYWSQ